MENFSQGSKPLFPRVLNKILPYFIKICQQFFLSWSRITNSHFGISKFRFGINKSQAEILKFRLSFDKH